jgi:prepilin-type N-terminal cleavage/methylation domain-containing protein
MTCNAKLKPFSRNSAGFTLVEVLVSLTIMALITGVAFSGLSAGIDSWRRGSQKIEELDTRFTLERLLQRQVSLAEPQLFHGSEEELEFVSTYSLLNGPVDLLKVNYFSKSGEVLYTEASLSEYAPENSKAGISQRFAGVSGIRFRYLTEDREGRRIWAREWRQEMGLPLAVQVQVDRNVVTIPLVNRR